MAFMALGGTENRPTYFEVYAADKLVPTLKAAVIYSLSVLGQSRSWLLRLLNYEDEVFALVSLLLERHSLSTLHATFAESLYGLKRQPAPPGRPHGTSGSTAAATSSSSSTAALLSTREQHLALLCQVLLPYLRSKLDQMYARHTSGGVLGLALSAAAAQQERQQQQQQPSRWADSSSSWMRVAAAVQRRGTAALVLLYPWLSAGLEAARFCYQLGYLLEATDCHTPLLQLLGQRLVRLSGPELAAMEKQKAQHRQQQLQRAQQHSHPAAARLHQWWLRGSSLATDHLRTVLILSVFGFKVLEWWFTSGEERLPGAAALPPPPPPAAPAPDPQGVGLPRDVRLCPLCRQARVNPAVLAVSGYSFCYPCLFRHVSEQHCCPVTRAPAGLAHIRKLYEAM